MLITPHFVRSQSAHSRASYEFRRGVIFSKKVTKFAVLGLSCGCLLAGGQNGNLQKTKSEFFLLIGQVWCDVRDCLDQESFCPHWSKQHQSVLVKNPHIPVLF